MNSFSSTRLLAIFLEQEVITSPTKADISTSHHKQSFYSLAKCISVISVGSGPEESINVSSRFIGDLKTGNLTDVQIVIALLSVGEIGRYMYA